MYGNEKRSSLIIYSAVFVALITVGGWISIPFVVPFTLQTMFVLLAASVMKKICGDSDSAVCVVRHAWSADLP